MDNKSNKEEDQALLASPNEEVRELANGEVLHTALDTHAIGPTKCSHVV